jgi:NAD(P) transhydrogenase subunit beta
MIVEDQRAIVDSGYVIAALLVLAGLRDACIPRSGRRGVRLVALGLGLAVLGTFASPGLRDTNLLLIVVGLLIGGALGWVFAYRLRITELNGYSDLLGGLTALSTGIAAIAAFLEAEADGRADVVALSLATVLSALMAGVGVTQFVRERSLLGTPKPELPHAGQIQLGVAIATLAALIGVILLEEGTFARLLIVLLLLLALALTSLATWQQSDRLADVAPATIGLGVGPALLLLGGALSQEVLLIFGALVLAAAVFLTRQAARMAQWTVVEAILAVITSHPRASRRWTGRHGVRLPHIRELTPEDAALQLAYAQRVIIVPGYGLATSQSQHAVRSLAQMLMARGIEVRYALHPAAGRVPGQISAMLSEADVPLADLRNVAEANEDLKRADIALVIGASDIINPAAYAPNTPLSGLPIVDVEQAGTVIVLKRTLMPGFSGIENDVFRSPQTAIIFGDARESLTRLMSAMQAA